MNSGSAPGAGREAGDRVEGTIDAMEVAIGFWIVCAIVSGIIASSRGLSGCLYTFLGFLLGPFGVLMACVIPARQTVNVPVRPNPLAGGGFESPTFRQPVRALPESASAMRMRTCPECLSEIPAAAKVCRYCQRESMPEAEAPDALSLCYGGKEHDWVWSDVFRCWRCAVCYMYQGK